MTNITKICQILESEYANAQCALKTKNGFQLLVSARLSAQCTDVRVNMVTPFLFKKFPNSKSLANAEISEIENIIKPCGLFKVKAKNLKDMCIMLENDFNSKIPSDLKNLQKLPGIGRKTANLILSEIFGQPSVVVDTHVMRVTRKLGLHSLKDPFKIEMVIRKCVEKSNWSNFCHRIINHGRKICNARNPKCQSCCLKKECEFYVNNYKGN